MIDKNKIFNCFTTAKINLSAVHRKFSVDFSRL